MGILNWIRRLFECGHYHANWRFAGYHSHYRNQSSQDFDTVLIKEEAHCFDCGRHISRYADAPPKLSKLFFDNYHECMSEDPAVIKNKEIHHD